ncbi:IclR family transcriptional regulator [Pigmentiphaga litoralis]|uniref:DNA-binding IclR family transcriptional regulator n=1 Tax=Pigmentiphaga litoralis TaxID=516702 RepID=A0A7Y9LQ14_9BURK|nr:IclR family transcriptional regulator [Pigmentiphaga litoralis]NYE26170.1 DNA-binding IclR family transcriptional regulator [Pigmentiphaga litoralis]NYE85290.1 DNA-binding IclR family transcriptional regulator [Pigmentiphaga litoralis]
MRRHTVPPIPVNALERGFAVLECFAAAGRPLGNGDVAQATGIPRPTAYRLISTLVALGQLRPCPDSDKYELAAGVVRLAQSFLGKIDARRWVRPHLVALAEACSASAFLALRDGKDVLVVEAARARSAVAYLGADVGTRMSLATSALGRAWLAGVDATTRDAVLAELQAGGHLAGHPDLAPRLEAALRKARRVGYAVSLGEWQADTNAAAVPIRVPSGEVFSLNCGSPSFLTNPDKLRDVVIPRLIAAAAAFAADVGGLSGSELMAWQDAQAAPSALPPASPALPPASSKQGRRRSTPRGDTHGDPLSH